jgi:predicted enzyme related to lactoylglutathione lyase
LRLNQGAFFVAGARIGRDNAFMTLSAQLTHFGVHTTDLDRMVDFYTRVMGFVVSDSGTGGSGARIAFMTHE